VATTDGKNQLGGIIRGAAFTFESSEAQPGKLRSFFLQRIKAGLDKVTRFNRELPRRFFRKVQNDLNSILFVIQPQDGLFLLRHNSEVEVPGNC